MFFTLSIILIINSVGVVSRESISALWSVGEGSIGQVA